MPNFRSIRARLELAAAALFKRHYYDRIFAMAQEGEMGYRDVVGDLDPFELIGVADPLDFSRIPAPCDFLGPDQLDCLHYLSEPGASRFIARLAVHRRARVIVELGCFVGATTAHLALAAAHIGPDCKVYAADVTPRAIDCARINLARLNGGNQTVFFNGDACSLDFLNQLPPQLDLVFIDTSHDYLATVREIEVYGARLSPGGCIVLHDSLSFAGVRKAAAASATRYRICTFATEAGNGLTILLPRSSA
jgi:predicted O-methyltransferase YrrM